MINLIHFLTCSATEINTAAAGLPPSLLLPSARGRPRASSPPGADRGAQTSGVRPGHAENAGAGPTRRRARGAGRRTQDADRRPPAVLGSPAAPCPDTPGPISLLSDAATPVSHPLRLVSVRKARGDRQERGGAFRKLWPVPECLPSLFKEEGRGPVWKKREHLHRVPAVGWELTCVRPPPPPRLFGKVCPPPASQRRSVLPGLVPVLSHDARVGAEGPPAALAPHTPHPCAPQWMGTRRTPGPVPARPADQVQPTWAWVRPRGKAKQACPHPV